MGDNNPLDLLKQLLDEENISKSSQLLADTDRVSHSPFFKAMIREPVFALSMSSVCFELSKKLNIHSQDKLEEIIIAAQLMAAITTTYLDEGGKYDQRNSQPTKSDQT